MKAALLEHVRSPLVIDEVLIDKPGPHEVLIRTAACGVCGSDLHFVDGHYPHKLPCITGHEAAGIVEAVGADVTTVRKGDAVVTCMAVYCGCCEFCLTERMALCQGAGTTRPKGAPPRLSRDGKPVAQLLHLSGHAEMMLVHEHACVAIDPDMPLDRAAILGCAVLTGSGAVFHAAKVTAGETVAIVGCGGVGLAAVAAARIASAGRIIACDPVPEKRALALALGATDTIDTSRDDAAEHITELTNGGVHHAIEAVGHPTSATLAIGALRRGGTATVLGMMPLDHRVGLGAMDLLAGKKLQGALMGGSRFPIDIPRLVDFYLKGKLDLDVMIGEHLPLDRINEGYDALRQGDAPRTIIIFD